jgi:hypothetical protein
MMKAKLQASEFVPRPRVERRLRDAFRTNRRW